MLFAARQRYEWVEVVAFSVVQVESAQLADGARGLFVNWVSKGS
jgi:hypothetical protein